MTEPAPPGRFRLLRYFTLATLGMFVAAAATMYILQRAEEQFFAQVQRERQAAFVKGQAELAQQSQAAARAGLLAVHEAAHVTLTRVVANLLWASDFGPMVARAQRLPVEPCRALPLGEGGAPSAERRACLQQLGQRIRALPGHAALDAKAYEAMRATRVFKIKVWDLRGVTVYSSEAAQIGDDGAANQGWRSAAAGQPASELTHRDRFSAFEGVVENRDLISTYVPVRDPRGGAVLGVVELYSDVTPLLEQVRASSQRFAELSAANEARLAQAAQADQDRVEASSNRFLLVVGGLLALLYVASLLIVRIGQRFLDRQTQAQEQAARREQLWHREKMAALAAMADNVAHEVGNPLAVIAAQAQQAPQAPGSRLILEQAERIAQMMRRISDFASARGGERDLVDVNAMLKAVCDFHAFDRRFRGSTIEFRPAAALPARELVPDRLNELMMSLLQAGAEQAASSRLVVATALRGDDVVVRVEGGARIDAAQLEPIRRLADAMGARVAAGGGAVEIVLPAVDEPTLASNRPS